MACMRNICTPNDTGRISLFVMADIGLGTFAMAYKN
uniref:Uncharacterized protein n=1 Tax=Arundo donax TaxID=35708 RepID=A0A0A9F4S0_ARUDO